MPKYKLHNGITVSDTVDKDISTHVSALNGRIYLAVDGVYVGAFTPEGDLEIWKNNLVESGFTLKESENG